MGTNFFDYEENKQHKSASETNIWIEKYRPRKLADYVGNEALKKKAEEWIETGDLPSLLLLGPPGTGKTTLARILTSELNCDEMYVNASDENSVDMVRNRIKQFASSVATADLKVVVLDEFDYMSRNAQAALRNMMETFSGSTRFILTGNYGEQVERAIKSRSQVFRIEPPSKAKAAEQLANILNKEGVQFDKKDIVTIVNRQYPDLRGIIGTAQKNTVAAGQNGQDRKLELSEAALGEQNFHSSLLEMLGSESVRQIRQLVQDSDVSRYERTFRFLYDHVDELSDATGKDVPSLIVSISEAQTRAQQVVDKEINFMHLVIDVTS